MMTLQEETVSDLQMYVGVRFNETSLLNLMMTIIIIYE